jgi:predicted nucleic-acid-binding Zn-ribbon protein
MGDLLNERKCPKCGSTDLTNIGCAPDGIRLNLLFDCNKCYYGFEADY